MWTELLQRNGMSGRKATESEERSEFCSFIWFFVSLSFSIFIFIVVFVLLLIYRYNCQMTKWGVLLHQLQKWWPMHWEMVIWWWPLHSTAHVDRHSPTLQFLAMASLIPNATGGDIDNRISRMKRIIDCSIFESPYISIFYMCINGTCVLVVGWWGSSMSLDSCG